MSKPKHTPGPWATEDSVVGDQTGLEQLNVVTSDYNFQICACPYESNNGMYASYDEATANARLIAASPDMLKMLELAIRELEWADKNCQIKPMAGVSTFKTAVAQIKSVIAKATGGNK